MFEWLRRLWRSSTSPPKAIQPDAVVSVRPAARASFDDKFVRCQRADGTTEEVSWDELVAVEILTTDAGPFVCDVFFVLHGRERGCVVPQEAEGCTELLERLQKLPRFNNQAVIDAMSCATNARFRAWQNKASRHQAVASGHRHIRG